MQINNFLNSIYSSKIKYNLRLLLIIINDLSIINISLYLSYSIRLEEFVSLSIIDIKLFYIVSAIYIIFFFLLKIHLQFFRHFNINSYKRYFKFYIFYGITMIIFLLQNNYFFIPRSLVFIFPTLSFILIFINRLVVKNILDLSNYLDKQKVAILGFSKELTPLIFSNDEIKIIIDENKYNLNRTINNVKIISLESFYQNIHKINKILIYDLEFFEKHKSKLRKFIFDYDICVSILKKYQRNNFIEDTYFDFNFYFDRDLKKFKLDNYYDSKTILITGGAGSVGSKILSELLKTNYKKIIIVDNSEINTYELINSNLKLNDNIDIYINNFEDNEFIEKIHQNFKIDLVFHCAAYKHVPLMEIDNFAAIKNNFLNSHKFFENLIRIGVRSICLISSDKAVRPTNIMGASKRLAELSMQYHHFKNYKNINNLKLSFVRFGNVINSSGSVLPVFKNQIKNNKNITLTHKKITRYFMTIEEASNLVITSFSIAKSNDIFLLDMGEPIKIFDLINLLIKFSGKRLSTNQDSDYDKVKIDYIGLREGEKLFEELLIDHKAEKTKKNFIFKSNEKKISQDQFISIYENILNSYHKNDKSMLRKILSNGIINYQPIE